MRIYCDECFEDREDGTDISDDYLLYYRATPAEIAKDPREWVEAATYVKELDCYKLKPCADPARDLYCHRSGHEIPLPRERYVYDLNHGYIRTSDDYAMEQIL